MLNFIAIDLQDIQDYASFIFWAHIVVEKKTKFL